VTENIYDSPTGRILLDPAGTRIIGQYDNNVQFGQRRVLLVWNRLILPNGRSIVLERQPGADTQAMPGLRMASITIGGISPRPPASPRCSVGAELAVSDEDRLLRHPRRRPGHHQRRRPADRPPPAQVAPTLTIRPGFRSGHRHPRPCARTLQD
jgi:type IV secretion system protein VirB10